MSSLQTFVRAASRTPVATVAKIVDVTHFSDVLCVWAYISEARIDALKRKFGRSLRLTYRFCSVFGDSADKVKSGWKEKGEYEGFNSHLQHIAAKFPHVEIHPELWLETRPKSSASPHLFLKAIQQLEWERAGRTAAAD